MEKKITKKDVLTAITALISDNDSVQVGEIVVTGADIADYVAKTIEQIENKAAKAKERAATKKSEGDELRHAVADVLTEELQTAEDILGQIEAEDITKSKVVARLTALIKDGFARKEQIKVDSRKVMGYALPAAVEEAPVEE